MIVKLARQDRAPVGDESDPGGDGEIAIALRCARVSEGAACLYAGAGIVAESEPAIELGETRLKLKPLLDLLAAP